MVPVLSIVCMAITLAVCFGVPLGAMIWLSLRKNTDGSPRHDGLWRPFAAGMLAFVGSQVLTRLPLMSVVVPQLSEPYAGFLLSGPVASYTAGLLEETGRLLVMLWLLRAAHRWIDGIAFGLGHGGIEAMLLVGLSYVTNLVLAVMINTGTWPQVAAGMPADAAARIEQALTQTPPTDFLAAGAERLSALSLHIGCSLLVLAGIVHGRKLLAWVLAVLLHGSLNLLAVLGLASGWTIWTVEAALAAGAALIWVGIVASRPWFPDERGVVPTPEGRTPGRRQDRVKAQQGRLNGPACPRGLGCTGAMTQAIEHVIGLIVGIFLVLYLLYALRHAEEF